MKPLTQIFRLNRGPIRTMMHNWEVMKRNTFKGSVAATRFSSFANQVIALGIQASISTDLCYTLNDIWPPCMWTRQDWSLSNFRPKLLWALQISHKPFSTQAIASFHASLSSFSHHNLQFGLPQPSSHTLTPRKTWSQSGDIPNAIKSCTKSTSKCFCLLTCVWSCWGQYLVGLGGCFEGYFAQPTSLHHLFGVCFCQGHHVQLYVREVSG